MKRTSSHKKDTGKISGISYRLAKKVPTDSVVALYKSAGWWDEETGARHLIPAVVRNSFAFAVAQTADGKIVGMGRVISDGVSDAYIQDLAVLKAYRGRGIGRDLVRLLTAYCEEKNLLWIGTVAEPGTYPFYRGLGFKDKKGFQLMLLDDRAQQAKRA